MKLTEREKKKIIDLIETGKTLPAVYKSKLFDRDDTELIEATKDYRLVYKGKARKEDIIAQTPAAPFQKIRSFRSGNPFKDDWQNMLIFGDNLLALKTLYEDQRGENRYKTKNRIKLIYIDPPFATKQDFMKDREKAYRDKIIGAQFIEFLRKRLILMREVLADNGSIYVHLDWKKGHYIKAILDEVFGEHNFGNEIIWQKIRSVKAQGSTFGNVHDSIFYYKKSDNLIFNQTRTEQNINYIKKFDKTDPKTEKRYQLVSLLQKGSGPPRKFGEVTLDPGPGRHWIWDQGRIDGAMNSGEIEITSGGKPRKKQYLDETGGRITDDIWTDIFPINSQANEALDYPTQKPEKILGGCPRIAEG